MVNVCNFFLTRICCIGTFVTHVSCVTMLLTGAALLYPPPSAGAAPLQYSLAYGKFLNATDAAVIAKSTAWVNALKHATQTHTHTATRLAAHDALRRRALLAASLTPEIRVDTIPNAEETSPPSGMVLVTVRLTTSESTHDHRVREVLQCPDRLAVQTDILQKMQSLNDKAQEHIQYAQKTSWNSAIAIQENIRRIHAVAQQIDALWGLQQLLPRLCTTWDKPNNTAYLLKQALKIDGDNALLWCALGETQLQLDNAQEAMKLLDTALEKEPRMDRARVARGLAHLRLSQPALAEADLNVALQNSPDTVSWLRVRGAIRMVLGKHESMCRDFIKACTLGDCDGLKEARKRSLCVEAARLP